ncbi:putative uncharacterized protein [Burkholderiales bacterium GJ-E10]|jgi:hypothetical protein|nr:putative uncharacterized protein [Burkholderiales bacterium GJ-E10]
MFFFGVHRQEAGKETEMAIAHALSIGFVIGIVLFFVLQRIGVIDRWIERLEK